MAVDSTFDFLGTAECVLYPFSFLRVGSTPARFSALARECFFSSRAAARNFLRFFSQRVALAADRLQILLEVVGTVIVVDFLAGRDVLDGANIDAGRLILRDVQLRIRFAGVVDIARDVLAQRAVDGPAASDLEEILVLDRVVLLLVAVEQRPDVPYNLRAFLDWFGGEETEPRAGAANTIRLVQICQA